MRYKVGDKVRIRPDIEVGDCFHVKSGGETHLYMATREVAKKRGKLATIERVVPDGYFIEGDKCCTYTEDMLVPYKEGGMGYVIAFILGLVAGFFIAALCQIQKKDKRDEK